MKTPVKRQITLTKKAWGVETPDGRGWRIVTFDGIPQIYSTFRTTQELCAPFQRPVRVMVTLEVVR